MSRSLPEEVLAKIFERVSDNQTRLSLVRSSRTFYRMNIANLYHSIRVDGQHSIQAIAQLVETCFRNPLNAQTIKHLDLTQWPEDPDEPEDLQYDAAMADALLESVTEPGEFRDNYAVGLEEGERDAWLGLLVSMLTNLETLQFDVSHYPVYIWNNFVRAGERARPFHTRAPYPHLNEVHLQAADPYNRRMPVSCAMPFFKLPGMKRITMEDVHDWEQNPLNSFAFTHPLPIGTSTVEEIGLDRMTGCQGLHNLIHACSGLKKFKVGYFVYDTEGALLFDAGALRNMLAPTENSLECLDLAFNSVLSEAPTIEGEVPAMDVWMRNFTAFVNLKDLHIRLPNLIRLQHRDPTMPINWQLAAQSSLPSILPENLETLSITDSWHGWLPTLIDQLVKFADARHMHYSHEVRFPKFRTLDICVLLNHQQNPQMTREMVVSQMAKVRRACRNANIRFGLRIVEWDPESEWSEDGDESEETGTSEESGTDEEDESEEMEPNWDPESEQMEVDTVGSQVGRDVTEDDASDAMDEDED